MVKSMTAYGRASKAAPLGRCTVELQSVNRKFLDIHLHLPLEWRKFEMDIRKWLNSKIHSGQVTLSVTAAFELCSPILAKPNLPLAKQLVDGWKQISDVAQLSVKDETILALLINEKNLFTYESDTSHEEGYKELLFQTLQEAFNQFTVMREQEGLTLATDLEMRLDALKSGMEKIAERAKETPSKYLDKLSKKLQELAVVDKEHEERLLRELVIYAERVDITEEIIRFFSHLDQFEKLLQGHEEAVGKRMDFLLQELGREINTLGVKTPDLATSHLVVEIKSEIARIREQIQNIE